MKVKQPVPSNVQVCLQTFWLAGTNSCLQNDSKKWSVHVIPKKCTAIISVPPMLLYRFTAPAVFAHTSTLCASFSRRALSSCKVADLTSWVAAGVWWYRTSRPTKAISSRRLAGIFKLSVKRSCPASFLPFWMKVVFSCIPVYTHTVILDLKHVWLVGRPLSGW